jgi:hypothetical protein
MKRCVAVAAIILCAACSHSSNQSLTANGARVLQAEIASARVAAEQGDYARSAAGIADVEATVASLRAQHFIGSSRAADVLRAAATVRTALARLASPTPSTAPPTTAAPPPTPPPHGHGKGHGGDQGNDNGD